MNIYEKTTTTYVPEFSKEDIEFICEMYEFLWTYKTEPSDAIHNMVTWGLQYPGFAEALTIINLLGHRHFYKIATDHVLRDRLTSSLEEFINKCTDVRDSEKATDMLVGLRKAWRH